MNQYDLAKNIIMLLEKNNKDIKELANALNLQPRYLKYKLYKMTKSKDESFSFNHFLSTLEFFNVTLGDFIL